MENKQYQYHVRQAYQLFHEGILAFSKAEQQGLCVNMEYISKHSHRIEKKQAILLEKIKETTFYKHWSHTTGGKPNIYSNAQLAKFLYDVKKIKPVKFTKKGAPSTDEDTFMLLDIPELHKILEIRKLKKRRDYLELYKREQVDGVMRPFFNLHTVLTYRSSSDSPNFQNVPKRDVESMQIIRGAIIPREGHQFLEVDFGSIEVGIATCYHKDPTMLDYLIHEKDLHGDMAAQIFKIRNFDKSVKEYKILRGAAKNGFVFPQFYGDYWKNNAIGLAQWCSMPHGQWRKPSGIILPDGVHMTTHLQKQGIKDYAAFEQHIREIETDFWGKRFPVYKRWKETHYRQYVKTGICQTLTGFTLRKVMSKNEVINYPVQGSAFHCLLWCFIKLTQIQEERKWRSRLVGQIHDAILFDVHPAELQEVAETVKHVTTVLLPKAYKWIIVPMRIEADLGAVNASWADIEPYPI